MFSGGYGGCWVVGSRIVLRVFFGVFSMLVLVGFIIFLCVKLGFSRRLS